jgi:hypothetical protein
MTGNSDKTISAFPGFFRGEGATETCQQKTRAARRSYRAQTLNIVHLVEDKLTVKAGTHEGVGEREKVKVIGDRQ